MLPRLHNCLFFFFNDTATTEIYTLSLHDALPIFHPVSRCLPHVSGHDLHHIPAARALRPQRAIPALTGVGVILPVTFPIGRAIRSEEHTSELQSPCNLVCRLLLEKKKKT